MITSKIIAHRGLSSLAPENTLSAFKAAAENNISWVEIDAIALGDGTVVMWHDNSIDRCSDGQGSIDSQDANSIKNLDCGRWFSDEYIHEKMATLEEALIYIQSLGLGLNLELKLYNNSAETLAAPVLKLLEKHWKDYSKLIISSFDQSALDYCYRHNSSLQLGRLWQKIPDNWQQHLESIGAVSCHCDYRYLTQQQVHDIKNQGYEVYCYTANDPEAVSQHWLWGVDAIISDYPQRYL